MLCEACDIASVVPRPSPAELADFYRLDNYYTQGEGHFEKVRNTSADKVLVKLAWLLDRGSEISVDNIVSKFSGPASVCDLGCGSGKFLTGLKDRGWSATGVEPDPAAQSFLSDRGLDVHRGTAEHPPEAIRGRQFDLVIMTHVLEHCLNPDAALNNAAGLIKPGGLLLLEVPNKDCVHFRTFGAGSECYDAPRHLFFFGPDGLRRLVERQNLAVEEQYEHGLTRHHAANWRATERKIRDTILAAGGKQLPPSHTWLRSAILLAQEFLSPPRQRYDAIGLWARKPSVA
jgi:2-polyprenyl-3-methyl-5-hydroxy-6-metoxy-1,4-benzoquinol methylase